MRLQALVRVALFLFALPVRALETPFIRFDAIVSASAGYARGPTSWIEGGFGRLLGGGDSISDAATHVLGDAHVGLTLQPSESFSFRVQGVGRAQPDDFRGRAAGIVEAYGEFGHTFRENDVRIRVGQFFLPTSRENVEALWSSPYTLTLSALNSWIAEEVRPIGVDLQWRRELSVDRLTLGATVFQGNDSSGTLLGWRGWALGNRLSVYDEVLPLPPLFSIEELFVLQRSDGTKPIGRDLDGRSGFGARARYGWGDRALAQAAFSDNRGDRSLHRGEYAWRTRHLTLGGEYRFARGVTVVAEYMTGVTGMGAAPLPHVDASFHTEYLLVSHQRGRNRFSARVERFQTDDRDGTAESNDESGRAWTIAWMYEPIPSLRAGVEFIQSVSDRTAVGESGSDARLDARSLAVEIRFRK